MGEWTWLFQKFALADVELMGEPFDPETANVLVRTVRRMPGTEDIYEVRVAPHNVAPFKGGPWLYTFHETELQQPGKAIEAFRAHLLQSVNEAKRNKARG